MDYSKGENKDKSAEGNKWALITLLCGGVATIIPHPAIKLAALLVAIASGTNAVNCYKSSARIAYQQLATPEEHYQLPPA